MPDKSEDFSAWYNDVIERADLIDKRYPVKGMDIWRPYGLRLMRNIDSFTRDEMDRTDHLEVEFPLLIPKTEFAKEAEHIEGFDAQVFWVTHGGTTELDVPLVVRPTSETAMYPIFSLWIRSHTDLPARYFQIVNTFRYETKQTRSFMRVREIHFFEAHTCHTDYDDAEDQIRTDQEVWANLAEKMCLPYVLAKRPTWDTFPGAHYSIGADILMPELKTLQCATFHHYDTNFAEAYDITYETTEAEHEHVHQTTYGMSERLVGAIVGVHGDDNGVIMPPELAPTQVVIVPIVFSDTDAPVLERVEELRGDLEDAGFRVEVDDRDESPGYKFHDQELRGVPVRLEIGPRDLKNEEAVLATRHDGEKSSVPLDGVVGSVGDALDAVADGLLHRAAQLVEENMHEVSSVDEAAQVEGIARAGWCGDEACGERLEEETGKDVLGVPVKDLEPVEEPYDGVCVVCGDEAEHPVLLSRTY